MAAPSSPTTIAALNASTGTTTLVLVALLIALGVAMVLTAVWLVRATRSDPAALAPLEAMGTRRWRRADADRRAALLADARPDGAPEPAPMVPYGDEPPPAAASMPVASVEAEPVSDADPEPAVATSEPEPDPEPRADVEQQPVATPESS